MDGQAEGSPSATPADLSWVHFCSAFVTLSRSPSSAGHSTYHLSNFARVVHRTEKIIVHTSVVSCVSDAVLGMQICDDRLPVTLEALEKRNSVRGGLHRRPPKCVWQIIGLVLGLRPVGLRSAAVAGALTSSSYLLMRFAAGDEGKLQFLLEGPEPVDMVPWKMYQLVAWSTRCKNSCKVFASFKI